MAPEALARLDPYAQLLTLFHSSRQSFEYVGAVRAKYQLPSQLLLYLTVEPKYNMDILVTFQVENITYTNQRYLLMSF